MGRGALNHITSSDTRVVDLLRVGLLVEGQQLLVPFYDREKRTRVVSHGKLVKDGSILFDKGTYDSLCKFASVARVKMGAKPGANGWLQVHYKEGRYEVPSRFP